jgi:hypothetical protein
MTERMWLWSLLVLAVSGGLVVSWWAISASAAPVTKVTVFDKEFRNVRTIASERELEKFNELWSRRVVAAPGTPLRYFYKLQIVQNGYNNSWFYDPVGVTQVLAIHKRPVYLVPSAAEFDALLGVDSCSDQLC